MGLVAYLGRLVGSKGVRRGCQKRSWRQRRSNSPLGHHFQGFGRLWGPSGHAFWEVLGGPGGAKWVPKASKNGAKRGLDVIVALSRLWDFIFQGFGKLWDASSCSEEVHPCLKRALVRPRCLHLRASRSHVKKGFYFLCFSLLEAL